MFVWYLGGHYNNECLTDEEKEAMVRIPHPPLNILRTNELHAADKGKLSKWRKVIHAIVNAANLPIQSPSRPYIQNLFVLHLLLQVQIDYYYQNLPSRGNLDYLVKR